MKRRGGDVNKKSEVGQEGCRTKGKEGYARERKRNQEKKGSEQAGEEKRMKE